MDDARYASIVYIDSTPLDEGFNLSLKRWETIKLTFGGKLSHCQIVK